MPYEVRPEGDVFCVFNSDTDEKKACHETKELAERQVKLLEGLEHGTIDE